MAKQLQRAIVSEALLSRLNGLKNNQTKVTTHLPANIQRNLQPCNYSVLRLSFCGSKAGLRRKVTLLMSAEKDPEQLREKYCEGIV